MMRLRQSQPARDVNLLDMRDLSEFNLGLMKMSTAVFFDALPPGERQVVEGRMGRAKEFITGSLDTVLGESFTDKEKSDISSWFEVCFLTCFVNPANRELKLTNELLRETLEQATVAFIIDHHKEILSADNLHLVIDYNPDTAGNDSLNYRVLGAGAKLIMSDRRHIGELFTYGEHRFCIEAGEDGQLNFSFRKVFNPDNVVGSFEFPKYIPPEDMAQFAEVAGTKSNQGWEEAIPLKRTKFSASGG